jgi:hypothetical protein
MKLSALSTNYGSPRLQASSVSTARVSQKAHTPQAVAQRSGRTWEENLLLACIPLALGVFGFTGYVINQGSTIQNRENEIAKRCKNELPVLFKLKKGNVLNMTNEELKALDYLETYCKSIK